MGAALAMRNLEEGLPLLKEESLQRAARSNKATTCEGCDGFHPRVPLMVEFLENVEQFGKWPQQACMTMFFLIPKNISSDRHIAHLLALIRWWECVRLS